MDDPYVSIWSLPEVVRFVEINRRLYGGGPVHHWWMWRMLPALFPGRYCRLLVLHDAAKRSAQEAVVRALEARQRDREERLGIGWAFDHESAQD